MSSTRKKVQAVAVLLFICGALVWFGLTFPSHAQGPAMSSNAKTPTATPWRPKNGVYVGAQSCAKCHVEESAHQHATSMGRALEPAQTSEILRSHTRLNFRIGPYSYQIIRQGDQSIYTVTDGVNTFSEPILYSFGQGKAGQTYVFQHNGTFYESRVSYYRDTQNLDWTLGYPHDVPPSLDVAPGRALSVDETRSCFICHSTAATKGQQLQLDHLIPGVSCEACHGPGADHITAMEAKDFKNKHIFNPGKMEADEMSQEFCGSCHRSAETVAENKTLQGINSVRFQPYRLFTSSRHDTFDTRLSCVACHDPHDNPKHDDAFYDAKCLVCHHSNESLKSEQVAKAETAAGQTDKACPVARKDCVSCHMPKVEIPGSHFQFTDHRIRIAKPGEPFPN